MSHFATAVLAAHVFVLVGRAGAQAGASADTLRGLVTTGAGVPRAAVLIQATVFGTATTTSATTDAAGAYRIIVPNGSGDYLVVATATGLGSGRQRVRREPQSPPGSPLVVNFVLEAVAQLDTVRRVTPRRPRIDSGEGPGTTSGVGAQSLGGFYDLAGDFGGDLALALGLLPGVFALQGGGLATGGGSTDNAFLLRGFRFTDAALPRDFGGSLGLATSSANGGVSGFSGAAVTITPEASAYWRGKLRGTFDHPSLQSRSPFGLASGGQYSNVQLSGSAQNRIPGGGYFSVAAQAGQRNIPTVALTQLDEDRLGAAGLSIDAVTRLVTAAEEQGLRLGSHISARNEANGSLFATLGSSRTRPTWFTADISANWRESRGISVGPYAAPTVGFDTQRRSVWTGLVVSRWVHSSFLSRTGVAANLARSSSEKPSDLPAVSVLLESQLPDGPSIQTAWLGGSRSVPPSTNDWGLQVRQELSWLSMSGNQQFNAVAYGRLDGASVESPSDVGTFQFASIDDFEARRPASFSRALGRRIGSSRIATASVALTEGVRMSGNARLTAAVNIEGFRYLDEPSHDASTVRLLGSAAGNAPVGMSFSPRVGVTWNHGTLPARLKESGGHEPRGTLSMTAGLYAGSSSPHLLLPALQHGANVTDRREQLECVGDAVPRPDWPSYDIDRSRLPIACAVSDVGATTFGSKLPAAIGFGPGYGPPVARRVSASWSLPILRQTILTLNTTLDNTVSQPSAVDVNLSGSRVFSLAREAGRPVFVAPGMIVQSTGAVSGNSARADPSLGPVLQYASDLSSRRAVFMASVSTARRPFDIPMNTRVTYSRFVAKEQSRGFGGHTTGDPRERTWHDGSSDGQHQVHVVHLSSWPSFRFTAVGALTSGFRFSPQVGGDLNGDGYSNDLPYVFAPGTVQDQQAAAAMKALLGSKAGRCLVGQVDAIVTHNRCRGPWTKMLNLRAELQAPQLSKVRPVVLSLSLTNALGAFDALVHAGGQAKGWGQTHVPERTLLTVTGFDSATRQFRYVVNPRFGQVVSSAARTFAPYRITLDVSLDLGPEPLRQRVTAVLNGTLTSTRRRSEAELFRALVPGSPPTGIRRLLARADSLGLTKFQRDSLASIVTNTTAKHQAIWRPATAHLASLSATYDWRKVSAYIDSLVAEQGAISWEAVAAAVALLSPTQLAGIPAYERLWFQRRTYTSR